MKSITPLGILTKRYVIQAYNVGGDVCDKHKAAKPDER